MNVHLPAPHRGWPARLVNLAVVVVVLALAAATFVLSYSGVHVIALQAGVSARLARVYPATFDAVLVIACVAAVTLRDAGWWARSYAWLTIIVVVGVVGAADAVHAMNVALQHRTIEGVVAATPWVLALLGFSLMLTMLRHSRAQRAADAPGSTRPSGRAPALALPPAQEHRPVPAHEPAASPAAVDAAYALDRDPAADANAPEADVVMDGTPAADDDGTPDDGSFSDAGLLRDDDVAGAPDLGDDPAEPAVSWQEYWDTEQENGPAGQPDTPAAGEPDIDAPPFATAPFATVPRLNRVRSTPTPPKEDEE